MTSSTTSSSDDIIINNKFYKFSILKLFHAPLIEYFSPMLISDIVALINPPISSRKIKSYLCSADRIMPLLHLNKWLVQTPSGWWLDVWLTTVVWYKKGVFIVSSPRQTSAHVLLSATRSVTLLALCLTTLIATCSFERLSEWCSTVPNKNWSNAKTAAISLN